MSEKTKAWFARGGAVLGALAAAPLMVLALSGTAQAAEPPTVGQGVDQTLNGVRTTLAGLGTALGGNQGNSLRINVSVTG